MAKVALSSRFRPLVLFSTPVRCEYCPLKIDARDGQQSGLFR